MNSSSAAAPLLECCCSLHLTVSWLPQISDQLRRRVSDLAIMSVPLPPLFPATTSKPTQHTSSPSYWPFSLDISEFCPFRASGSIRFTGSSSASTATTSSSSTAPSSVPFSDRLSAAAVSYVAISSGPFTIIFFPSLRIVAASPVPLLVTTHPLQPTEATKLPHQIYPPSRTR
ncbi:hypothetical protein Bca52824_028758 [Brassica carinata]|uniref:Uncharacterized protein n=1 Tax=Brassica carinata TaxID=52824 RepID=A0A8X8ANJ7_BRACI|nr:hypothetical protein Bca52824_028758 [Brassica carinata]